MPPELRSLRPALPSRRLEIGLSLAGELRIGPATGCSPCVVIADDTPAAQVIDDLERIARVLSDRLPPGETFLPLASPALLRTLRE